ncbi:MAG: hypothetical protein LIP03_09995 [Bacteroidales bacterium]|nr:hypothetical protein [Bacteroidales bacterium]
MNLEDYIEQIKASLTSEGRYSRSLDIQIYTLASAMVSLEMATNEISRLNTVLVKGLHGDKAHPAFKIQKDAQDSVTRQMKALNLTGEAIISDEEEDPLIELTKAVIDANKGKKSKITPRK